MHNRATRSLLTILFVVVGAGAVQADISISKQPTQNMSCNAGVCMPTAPEAVLNIHDLKEMLAASDLTVQTGNGDHTTAGITIVSAFSWTNGHRLTLTAKKNLTVKASITVAGTGALTINYNAGKTGGDLTFVKRGKINFWDISSSLVINGATYGLVGDIETLDSDITAKPSANYALANDLDETGKVYKGNLIGTPFSGVLTGLGHTIANLLITIRSPSASFLYEIDAGGGLRDISFQNTTISRGDGRGLNPGALVFHNRGTIQHVSVTGQFYGDYYDSGLVGSNESSGIIRNANVSATISGAGYVGGIAGYNSGIISNSSASGSLGGGLPTACTTAYSGALAGVNSGTIVLSRASTNVDGHWGEYKQDGCEIYAKAGGLVGSNYGSIDRSFATGDVVAREMSYIGGLAGYTSSSGTITNSYSLGSAHTVTDRTRVGGFIGYNTGALASSYSVGAPLGGDTDQGCQSGGLIGCDGTAAGNIASAYWDFDTSGIADPSRGAGDPLNDPGITGLSDSQLKSGLPGGFDPKIWGSNPNINDGYPYLLANPPQ